MYSQIYLVPYALLRLYLTKNEYWYLKPCICSFISWSLGIEVDLSWIFKFLTARQIFSPHKENIAIRKTNSKAIFIEMMPHKLDKPPSIYLNHDSWTHLVSEVQKETKCKLIYCKLIYSSITLHLLRVLQPTSIWNFIIWLNDGISVLLSRYAILTASIFLVWVES